MKEMQPLVLGLKSITRTKVKIDKQEREKGNRIQKGENGKTKLSFLSGH